VPRPDWDAAKVAVVVCDMWDAHHCVTAERRGAELAPRLDVVVGGLRAQGALIVHAPGGCMDYYRDTPARRHAMQAPHADAPCAIHWNDWQPDEVAVVPRTLSDPGSCSCESAEPCGDAAAAWTRQTPAIGIEPQDVVTDDGQELFNVLVQRGIGDVVVMGVHTNICVLGRPYGVRQLVSFGMRPVLCRDLTDSFHRDPRGHFWGTAQVVAHIERRWCPSVTSDQLVGGAPFRFRGDV
jgi:nicotinamidase-related amidase